MNIKQSEKKAKRKVRIYFLKLFLLCSIFVIAGIFLIIVLPFLNAEMLVYFTDNQRWGQGHPVFIWFSHIIMIIGESFVLFILIAIAMQIIMKVLQVLFAMISFVGFIREEKKTKYQTQLQIEIDKEEKAKPGALSFESRGGELSLNDFPAEGSLSKVDD